MGEIQGKGRVGCDERNEMKFGNEKVRVRVEDDRISSLPDEIIHHILSFNDTKYAVQTSVLSSRWKLIWTTLPHLSFSSSEYLTQLKFAEFVNQLLSSRDDHCEVSSLCFCFNEFVRQEYVEKIISYALSHKVQKVKVIAPRLGGSVWNHQDPLCLLSSESLKDLTLRFSFFNKFRSAVPQSPWDFPALTTLNLYDMQFCADNTKFVELFSKCLNLKNLTIRECYAKDLEVMKIVTPRLENLSIMRCSYLSFIVSAPNMSSFKYDDEVCCPASLSGDLLLLDMVSLQLKFLFGNSGSRKLQKVLQRFEDKTFSMLEEVCDAKFLTLHTSVIEFLSTVPDVLAQPSPLSKLKCLNIKFDWLRESTNSAVIDQAVKYLCNSSSSANVIIDVEHPEKLGFCPHIFFYDGFDLWLQCRRRDMKQLRKMAEMLSLQETTDPQVRQVLEDVREKLVADCQEFGQVLEDVEEKLAAHCQELGLPPPDWSN